ncbi:MAG: hypothetical protein ING75_00530 [Rhodocyclaceae bacterium]|nr:hypothetical protein [Rhodocyclaceae bacterium]
MFKKMLAPADHSSLSHLVTEESVTAVLDVRAETVGFVATALYKMRTIKNVTFIPRALSKCDFSEAVKRSTKKYLDNMKVMADAPGAPFNGVSVTSVSPTRTMADATTQFECDLTLGRPLRSANWAIRIA